MADLEPASAFAERIEMECFYTEPPSFEMSLCARLIEADRAAVREAVLRELAEAVRLMRPDLGFAHRESGEYKGGFHEGHSSALAEVERLLTEKRTP